MLSDLFKRLVFLLISFLLIPSLAFPASVTLVYVTPNSGVSAGGHTAVKIGKNVYHYQFEEDGRFYLVRDNWRRFLLVYTELANRSLFLYELPVEKRQAQMLERILTLDKTRQDLDAYHEKMFWWTCQMIFSLSDPKEQFRLPGAGFFEDAVPSGPGAEPYKRLRKGLFARYGSNIIEDEITRINRGIERHGQKVLDQYWGVEFVDILQKRFALQAIKDGRPLARSGLIYSSVSTPLAPAERRFLEDLAHQLEDLISLSFLSKIKGTGNRLLINLARYLAVMKSLEEKRLVFLDPFPDKPKTVNVSGEYLPAEELAFIYERLVKEWRQYLTISVGKQNPILFLSDLERLNARMAELNKLTKGEQRIRVFRSMITPAKSAAIEVGLNEKTRRLLMREKENLQMELNRMEKGVKNQLDYNLLVENCSTKLHQKLRNALRWQERGGNFKPREELGFIPYMLHQAVIRRFPEGKKRVIMSRRLREVAKMEGLPGTLLRESNVLTSTLYAWRPQDSSFLMFTDNTFWLRPLYGVINTLYSACYGIYGLAVFPFDRGTRLKAGGLGVLYSLPEMMFVNIRKGSYFAPDSSFLELSP